MIIMVLNNVPIGVRGDLTRWLVEVKSGVYIGQVSARVRDKLWERCMKSKRTGGVFQAWSTNNEQGFRMRMSGIIDRRIVDWEGVELIQETQITDGKKKEVKNRHLRADKNC
jgi:CRISPR-associated protein Cas2